MTAFFQGTKTVGISGGTFRQTSHNEQHEHHTRIFREDNSIFQGNIYGYTHTATSDDGPIIAYSHTTNITRPRPDENSSRSFLGLPRGGPTHQLPSNDTPLLGDGMEHLSHNRDMTVERRPAFFLSETQHHTSEPSSYPSLDDQKLKAEFHTLSPEMQRYVIYMLGQLEKRTAASGDTTKPVKNVAPAPRGPTAGLANQKPVDIHSESGSREIYHIGNSISGRPITSSPEINSHSSDHGAPETQPLSDTKPQTAINNNRLSRQVVPDVAPKHSPEAKGSVRRSLDTLVRKARSLSKIFSRSAKSLVG